MARDEECIGFCHEKNNAGIPPDATTAPCILSTHTPGQKHAATHNGPKRDRQSNVKGQCCWQEAKSCCSSRGSSSTSFCSWRKMMARMSVIIKMVREGLEVKILIILQMTSVRRKDEERDGSVE